MNLDTVIVNGINGGRGNKKELLSDEKIYIEKQKKGEIIEPEVIKKDGKEFFVLYHGTPKQEIFTEFKTPTGLKKLDVTAGGVVYLTSNILVAKKYAGENGYVYEVLSEDKVSYSEQRDVQNLPKKQNKYLKNVYVNLPSELEVNKVLKSNNILIK